MKVKIDTKEKAHVITIHEPALAANMTEQMDKVVTALLQENVKNAIIDLQDIRKLDYAAARMLVKLHKRFYSHQASFVVCNLHAAIRLFLKENRLLDELNITPTSSEALDIVQMEEMEREMGL